MKDKATPKQTSPPPQKNESSADWKRDEKTGLFLPDGARKEKKPAGFGAKW